MNTYNNIKDTSTGGLLMAAMGISLLGMVGCHSVAKPDAYGNFEAVEVIVSADCNGKLLEFDLDEGTQLRTGEIVGWVDTTQLVLQRNQQRAEIGVLRAQLPEKAIQLDVARQELAKLKHEITRYTSLVKADASTAQQLDNLQYDSEIVLKKIAAQESDIDIQTRTLISRMEPLRSQILATQDRIDNAYVVNPIDGVVLSKYAERHELAAIGKPLYKIANLDTLTLRAYIEEPQLASIKLGQRATIQVDSLYAPGATFEGTIGWIADKAEFTPKVIQTKTERANLVYAIKIYVPNPAGALKIGMPAEVYFRQ